MVYGSPSRDNGYPLKPRGGYTARRKCYGGSKWNQETGNQYERMGRTSPTEGSMYRLS